MSSLERVLTKMLRINDSPTEIVIEWIPNIIHGVKVTLAFSVLSLKWSGSVIMIRSCTEK